MYTVCPRRNLARIFSSCRLSLVAEDQCSIRGFMRRSCVAWGIFVQCVCQIFLTACLTLVLIDGYSTGRFVMLVNDSASFAYLSACSLPYMPLWPGTQRNLICVPLLASSWCMLCICVSNDDDKFAVCRDCYRVKEKHSNRQCKQN